MYITYHKSIQPVGDESLIPHEILNEELREFIESKGLKQDHYAFHDNGMYFFIYLDNGDRVDVTL